MSINIPYDPSYFNKVPYSERKEIDHAIWAALSEFKASNAEIQSLAIECVSNLSNNQSLSRELASQGALKRFWGTLTGKNHNLQDCINESSARSLYAQQQILFSLQKQNASLLEFGAYLNYKQKQIELRFEEKLSQQMQQIRRICEQLFRIDQEFDHVMYRCPGCNFGISRTSVICPRCGYICSPQHNILKTFEARDCYNTALSELSEKALQLNSTTQNGKLSYRNKIDHLLKLLDHMALPDNIYGSAKRLGQQAKEQIDDCRIEIAVAGTVKAGKSTLINALMGKEIAVMDITPETSVLTKYQSTRTSGFVRVSFYSLEEWDSIYEQIQNYPSYFDSYRKLNADKESSKWIGHPSWFRNHLNFDEVKKELHRFTASSSVLHFFVKEVSVGIPGGNLQRDICLVDTPGLDDHIQIRSKIAEEYLYKADGILACVKESEINRNAEVQFISRMLEYKRWNRLCLLATSKDLIPDSAAEKLCQQFKYDILSKMMYPGEIRSHLERSSLTVSKQRFLQISALMYCALLAHNAHAEFKPTNMEQYSWIMRGRGYFTHDSILQNLDELKTYSGILLLQEVVDDIARAARKEKASQKKHIYINFVKNFNYLLKQHYSELEGTLTLLNANEKELLEMRSWVDEASKRIADASRILAVLNQKIGGI